MTFPVKSPLTMRKSVVKWVCMGQQDLSDQETAIFRGAPLIQRRITCLAAVVGVVVSGLTFVNTAVAQVSCIEWNTVRFFIVATPAEVSDCLDAGVSIKARGTDGETPLHKAAEYSESSDVVKVLLDAGANVNARDKERETPLHDAGFSASPGVIKALLHAGASYKARDRDGETPLHKAAEHSESPDVVKVLLDAGANINARDRHGETPLHDAAGYNESAAVVKLLLDSGANIHTRDRDGETPLHDAAEHSKSPEVIKVLLDAGANPKAKARYGYSPWFLIQDNDDLKGTDGYRLLQQAYNMK